MVPQSPEPVVEALRALAAPGGPEDQVAAVACLDTEYESTFLRQVSAHRLQLALADALARGSRPLPDPLRDAVGDDQLVRLQVGRVLGMAAEALDAADVPWLAFKGPVVAARMARPELRSFNDLDLLVDSSRFGDSIAALVDAGFDEVNENWEPYLRYQIGEVPLVVADVSVDLHWHVIGLAPPRRAIRFVPQEMIDRRRCVEIGGRVVPTFDAVDQLLHLAVHAGLGGAKRLDQFRDLAVVLAADPVDWDLVVARARLIGAGSLVAHVLDRARVAIGAAADVEALEALAGSSLGRRRRRDGDGITALRRSGVHWRRDSPWASARAIGGSAWALRPRWPSRHHGWDFLEEESLLYFARATGGVDGRQRFIDFVESS